MSASAYSGNPSLVNSQKWNFSPRLGASYSVDNRTVVRAGFGIFYGGLEGFGYGVNLGQNVPFNYTSNISAAGNCTPTGCPTDGILLETGFHAGRCGEFHQLSQPSRQLRAMRRRPYSEQYNCIDRICHHQQHVGHARDTLAASDSSFVRRISKPQLVRMRCQLPGSIFFSMNRFRRWVESTTSRRSAAPPTTPLQAKLQKRYSNGVSFLASYTWSHSIDNAQSDLADNQDFGYRAPGILPISAEMRNSAFDVRNRFAFDGNYRAALWIRAQAL